MTMSDTPCRFGNVMLRRPTSSYEKLFAASSPALGTTCQWMRLIRQDGVPCTQAELAAALWNVHCQIAPLRCVLEKDAESAADSFLSLRPDLEPIIVFQELPERYDGGAASPECLEQLAAEEATKGMGPTPDDAYNKPLWRAMVLEDGWVMLVFHHVISDGMSRKLFIRCMLGALANPKAEAAVIGFKPGALELLEEVVTKESASAIGNEVPLPPTENATLADACAAEEKKEDEVTRPTTPRDKTDDNDDRKLALESISIGVPVASDEEDVVNSAFQKPCWPSPDEIVPMPERYNQAPSAIIPNASRLRNACRSHGVAITSAIVAALALVVRRQMSETNGGADGVDPSEAISMKKIGVSLDIRRHLPEGIASDLFGCYATGVQFEEPLAIRADDSIWSLATLVATQIRDSATLDGSIKQCRKVKDQMAVPMSPESLTPLLTLIGGPDQGRTNPLNASNVGFVEAASSCGTVELDRLFSITSQTALGSYCFLNAATVRDDLFITLGSVYPTISKMRARGMLDDLTAILTEASA